jgi:hypothetical protein
MAHHDSRSNTHSFRGEPPNTDRPVIANYTKESILFRAKDSSKLFETDDSWSELIKTEDTTKQILFYLALPLAYVFDFLL